MERNVNEWNASSRLEGGKKKLEYSSLPLFGSFNEKNGKFIPLFESLSESEWNG